MKVTISPEQLGSLAMFTAIRRASSRHQFDRRN